MPFTVSLNNDADNIIILRPNHHSIINKAEPVFDKKRLTYICRNGLDEQVVLNQHI